MKKFYHPAIFSVLLIFSAVAGLRAQVTLPAPVTAALDRADDALTYESSDGKFFAHVTGETDITGYYLDGQPFGLIYSNPNDHFLLSPRLTLNLDATYGDRLMFFAKFRWDDGIDPGFVNDSARLDEMFVRATIVPQHLDLQVGKFYTVFGSWAGRHGAWDCPFITAPLVYDQVTSVLDAFSPANGAAFAGLRNSPDNNYAWAPVVWGPDYLPGAAAFATWGRVDLAVSGTTQALSARPTTWSDLNFSRPSFNGRLGWRVNEAWSLGVSGSLGPFLLSHAAASLPPGTTLSQYDQITVGGDASWAWHEWQVTGEFIFSRFEVPNVGNADTFSWYLETKYKITPQLFAAVRWNQQVYNQVQTPGGPQNWDNDEMRVDLALGYKWDTHVLTKIQYSWQHQETSFQNGQQMIAVQLVVKF